MNSFIVLVLFAIILILCWNINSIVFNKKLNYLNFYITMWCVAGVLSAQGLYEFYVPPVKVYAYLLIMLVVYEVVTIAAYKVKIRRANVSVGRKGNSDINWRLITIISLVCFIILFPYFVKSFQIAMTYGYHYVRVRVLNNEIFTARERLILQDIVQPLILVTTMLSFRELINKKVRLSSILSILCCVMYMLTLGNRWLLMQVLYIIITLIIGKYSINIIEIIKKNKVLFGVGCIIVAGLFFMTKQRSIRGSKGIIYDVYAYYIGGMHLFGIAVNSPDTFHLNKEGLLYGKEFFSSFISLINNARAVFDLPEITRSGASIINETVQLFYYVSPNTHMNNNVTMLYGFLRDFGIMGIIFNTAGLALVYIFLYKKRNEDAYSECMYLFAITLIPSLLFEWIYGRTYILLVFIILFVLKKFDKQKGIKNVEKN